MVVSCPKCRKKLNVPDEKIKPEGSKFKCPGCGTVLVVKKPSAPAEIKPLDPKKIIVAHENAMVVKKIREALFKADYKTTGVLDGVSVMVKAMEERPHLAIVDVALPKISGFDVSRRLKARQELKDIKLILLNSRSDQKRQRKEPAPFYGAAEYLDEADIETALLPLIGALSGVKKEGPAVEGPFARAAAEPPEMKSAARPEVKPVSAAKPPEVKPTAPKVKAAPGDEKVERAKRLARAIMSDIDLYGGPKVLEALKNDNFHEAFANELKEGLKHYEMKISEEIRSKGDFFNEELKNFLDKKRKTLGF